MDSTWLHFPETLGRFISLSFPASRNCLHSMTYDLFFFFKQRMLQLSDHFSMVSSPYDQRQKAYRSKDVIRLGSPG
jgi:hypothetical protein